MQLTFSVLLLYAGVLGSQSLQKLSWLGCELVEEEIQKEIQLDPSGQTETRYHHRNAVLQFGQPGDGTVDPDSVTFFVTASEVDMRQYVDGGGDQLQCEIHRYSTGGIQMRWPGPGAEEKDVWFKCTLRHSDGLIILTTFLRHTPAVAQEDYNKWSPIADKEKLITTAVMLVLTRSPSVEVGLLREQTLHCQFAVDHKRPDLTAEWQLQRHGERSKLQEHGVVIDARIFNITF